MLPIFRRLVVPPVAALALFALSGCAGTVGAAGGKNEPFTREKVSGTDLSRLRLDPKAAERLGVQTEKVSQSPGGAGMPSPTVSYAAVMYDAKGTTFIYTSPEPLVFLRQPVRVESIKDGRAVLTEGPPPGTSVVTVGGAELHGIEAGVGK